MSSMPTMADRTKTLLRHVWIYLGIMAVVVIYAAMVR